MGLTEDRISSKLKKLNKECATLYEKYAPREPKPGCMEEFDRLDEQLHSRLLVRPLSNIDIDMAIIDYKKKFERLCVKWS